MRSHFHLRNRRWIPKENILSFSTFATQKSDVSPRFSQIFIFHFNDICPSLSHFPIIFPSLFHHFPIIFSSFSHHFPIFPSFSHDFLYVFPSAHHFSICQRQNSNSSPSSPRPCVLYQLGASWGPEWTSETSHEAMENGPFIEGLWWFTYPKWWLA